MMIPSNMMLSLLRPNLYLPTVVIVWGVVSKSRSSQKHSCPLRHAIISGLWCNRLCAELCRPRSSPFLVRCDRGTLLCWRHLLPLVLVHKDRIAFSNRYLLPWIYACVCLWRSDRCWHPRWYGWARRVSIMGTFHLAYRDHWIQANVLNDDSDGCLLSRAQSPLCWASSPIHFCPTIRVTRNG